MGLVAFDKQSATRIAQVVRRVERESARHTFRRYYRPPGSGGGRIATVRFVVNSWEPLDDNRWKYGLTEQSFDPDTLTIGDTPDGRDFQADDAEQFALNWNEMKNHDASGYQGNQNTYPGSGPVTAAMHPIGHGSDGTPDILTPVRAWIEYSDPEAPLTIWMFDMQNGEGVLCS